MRRLNVSVLSVLTILVTGFAFGIPAVADDPPSGFTITADMIKDGELDLWRGGGVTDKDLPSLRGMLVKKLTITGPWVTDEGLKSLQGLPLTHLNLWGTGKITDEGLKLLQGLPLTHLELWNTSKITDEGLKSLQGLPLTSLTLIGCSQITDEGLKSLHAFPLTELNLANTGITDEGLKSLRGLSLTYLNLAGTKTSYEGMVSFLKEMPLQKLEVKVKEDTYAVDPAARGLLRKFPHTTILWGGHPVTFEETPPVADRTQTVSTQGNRSYKTEPFTFQPAQEKPGAHFVTYTFIFPAVLLGAVGAAALIFGMIFRR